MKNNQQDVESSMAAFAEHERRMYEKARALFREEEWQNFDPAKEEWIPFEEILADLERKDSESRSPQVSNSF